MANNLNGIYRGGPGDKNKKKKKVYTGIPAEDQDFPLIAPINIDVMQGGLDTLALPQMGAMPEINRMPLQQLAYGGGMDKNNANLIGSFGQGAISGASAGAALGPWGIAGGAVLGGLAAGLGAHAENQQSKELESLNLANQEKQNKSLSLEQQRLYQPTSVITNVGQGGQFAMGGGMSQQGAGGMEDLVSFDAGGLHEQNPLGGVPMGNGNSVEQGETEYTPENYVFSDRILINKQLAGEFKIPEKFVGKSFSDYSKELDKKYSMRKGDRIDANSKKEEMKRLIEAQEAFKRVEMPQPQQPQHQMPDGSMMAGATHPQGQPYAYGGNMDKMYANGGDLGNTEPLLKGIENVGAYAPLAYNLVQGLKPADKLRAQDYQTSVGKLKAPEVNINPLIAKNVETFNAQRDAIASASAGSSGSYLSNIANAQVNKQRADSAALVQKENIDAQRQMGADQFNIGNQLNVDNLNAQRQFRVDETNQASVAAKESHLGAAALQGQQIANTYAQNRFNKATANELVQMGYAKNAEEAFLIMQNPEFMKNYKRG